MIVSAKVKEGLRAKTCSSLLLRWTAPFVHFPKPSPMADLETLATPAPASASTKKKKKHSKKHKAASDAPTNVTVDASLMGGSSYVAAAPVVGYFPSGYDPLTTAAGAESAPGTQLFRHEKHPTWVDLVVRSPGGGHDFVGRSYAGEAAVPQVCDYALGVLDKASGTLRIVPIAGKKVRISSGCVRNFTLSWLYLSCDFS